MKREWKPGDVAMVTDESGTSRIAVYGAFNPRMKHHWHYDEAGIGRILSPSRPLVVIDPESEEDVDRLAAGYVRTFSTVDPPHPETIRICARQMRAALREFADPKPPRPEEPTGLGAVVEDSHGDKWVWMANGSSGPHWTRVGVPVTRAKYDAIDAVRVLSEGVQP